MTRLGGLILNTRIIFCIEAFSLEMENHLLQNARANVQAFQIILKYKSNTDTVKNAIKAI